MIYIFLIFSFSLYAQESTIENKEPKTFFGKGIDASRISTLGMGENFPAYSDEYIKEKKELNRRIEIKIQ